MLKIITESEEETKGIGRDLGLRLKTKGGYVLALTGNLGAGKTTFIKGLASGLGIKAKIKSPTFVIAMRTPIPKSRKMFYHFDLYRLKSAADLPELGMAEIIANPHHITAVEWPQKAKKILPPHTIHIRFLHGKDSHRRTIEIK